MDRCKDNVKETSGNEISDVTKWSNLLICNVTMWNKKLGHAISHTINTNLREQGN